MIKATIDDTPRIMAFMMGRPTVAMFPITNLRDHGMSGDHPKAMTFWFQDHSGQITDVLGISDAGIVLPVFTSATPPRVGASIKGRHISGIIGQKASVAAVKSELGLTDGDLDRVEPHFELLLDDLDMPDTKGLSLLPVAAVPRETMVVWRTQYGIDALDLDAVEAVLQSSTAVDVMIAHDSHRVLMDADTPLAITGFNSALPDTVMIGGVYTPAHLRGQGFAKIALALHLADAHVKGVKRAVLSAANASAAKVYAAIGFRQVGEFMIVIYTKPQVPNV